MLVIFGKIVIDSNNTKLFLEFINELLLKMKNENIENKIFILDNCSIHNNNMIKEIVHYNGHRLILLNIM